MGGLCTLIHCVYLFTYSLVHLFYHSLLILVQNVFTHVTEYFPHTECTQLPSTKPPVFSPYLENNHTHYYKANLSSIYLPTTILLISPFTQASTQRYHYTNHPGQQSEIH